MSLPLPAKKSFKIKQKRGKFRHLKRISTSTIVMTYFPFPLWLPFFPANSRIQNGKSIKRFFFLRKVVIEKFNETRTEKKLGGKKCRNIGFSYEAKILVRSLSKAMIKPEAEDELFQPNLTCKKLFQFQN